MGKEALLDRITLENVGFDLKQTADYHSRLLRRGADVEGRVQEAARDLYSYELESLEDNVFSFYPYYVHEFEGKKRIFSADKPSPEFLVVSQIDPKERNGAVVEGFQKLEDKIQNIQKGFFLWVSKDGDAGFLNINYPYHQVYFGEINGNAIQAAALKCDINERVLSQWLTEVSGGNVLLSDLSPRSFVTSPVVIETEEEDGVRNSLLKLKQIMVKDNTGRFYKDVSIDKVIMEMKSERTRQGKKVEELAKELLPYFAVYGQDARSLTQILGGRLYNLYNKYRDSRGNITLTGCGGGTKCVNELFTEGKAFGSGIFSTGFRVSEFGTKTRNFEFNEKGPCRLCGSDAPCGPEKICEACNNKIDSGELVI